MDLSGKESLSEERMLGSGGYSEVYLTKREGETYALKKIRPHLLKDGLCRKNVEREIAIMQELDHPNIIKLHDVIYTEDSLGLLLEYASGGSLYDLLKTYGKLPEQTVVRYVRDLVNALQYLHNREVPILHRDVKPENLLIGKDDTIKLADFGSANYLNEQRFSYVGTKEYMAPEMNQDEPQGVLIDVWCLGILIFELLVGNTPPDPLIFPSFISRPAEDLIKRLLKKDTKHRMNLSQLSEHIWMVKYRYSKKQIAEATEAKSCKILRNLKEKHEQICGSLLTPVPVEASVKKRSQSEDMEQISQNVEEYMQLIKRKAKLKASIKCKAELVIQESLKRELDQPFLQEQIERVTRKQKLLEQKMRKLREMPRRCGVQCISRLLTLDQKFKELCSQLCALPAKILAEVLSDEKPIIAQEPLPVSEYIFKLKLQMLQLRRDSLMELKNVYKQAASMK